MYERSGSTADTKWHEDSAVFQVLLCQIKIVWVFSLPFMFDAI
jgi:hypothetical protein